MGMDWKVRAAVFRVLFVLRFGSEALLQLQKSVTHLISNFASRVPHQPRLAPASA
jgi:hypothetical protein